MADDASMSSSSAVEVSEVGIESLSSSSLSVPCTNDDSRNEDKSKQQIITTSHHHQLDLKEDIIDGFAIFSFKTLANLEAFSFKPNYDISSTCQSILSSENSNDERLLLLEEKRDIYSCILEHAQQEKKKKKMSKKDIVLSKQDELMTTDKETKEKKPNLYGSFSSVTRHMSEFPQTTMTSSAGVLFLPQSNNKKSTLSLVTDVSDLRTHAADEKSMHDELSVDLMADYASSRAIGVPPPPPPPPPLPPPPRLLSATTEDHNSAEDFIRVGSDADGMTAIRHSLKLSPFTLFEKNARSFTNMPYSAAKNASKFTPVHAGSTFRNPWQTSLKHRIDEMEDKHEGMPINHDKRCQYAGDASCSLKSEEVFNKKIKNSVTEPAFGDCRERESKCEKTVSSELAKYPKVAKSPVVVSRDATTPVDEQLNKRTELQLFPSLDLIRHPYSVSSSVEGFSEVPGGTRADSPRVRKTDVFSAASLLSLNRSNITLVPPHSPTSSIRQSSIKCSLNASASASSSSSSFQPTRETVIVREHSNHHHHQHRPHHNQYQLQQQTNIKREHSSSALSRKTTSRNSDSQKTPLTTTTTSSSSTSTTSSSSSQHASSLSSASFPSFSLFSKESHSSNNNYNHMIHLPAPHPAFPSNFSAPSSSSLSSFSLPPFQPSGMYGPSFGLPTSPFLTSPMMGFTNHFSPESMLSANQEMLTRVQQELNTRFLQDRGFLPMPPFTLHAEMHQHQHLHHHQHLLPPGGYLPLHLSSDLLSLGKLPPGGLLQPAQNLSNFIDQEQFAKASGLPSYSGFGAMPLGGLRPTPSNGLPFGSGLSGAFQPKHGLSALNFTPATQLLLSLRDRDALSTSTTHLPKKHGRWCAAHVQVAWKIYLLKQRQPSNDGSSCIDILRNSRSLILPSGGSLLGDTRPIIALQDTGLPSFRHPPPYENLDLQFDHRLRTLPFDLTSNPRHSVGWTPLHQRIPSPGISWINSSVDDITRSDRNLERRERGGGGGEFLQMNLKTNPRGIGNRELSKEIEHHRSLSRPSSHANSVNSDRKQRSPVALKNEFYLKENDRFRSRSRSPLRFSSSRSSSGGGSQMKCSNSRPDEANCKSDIRKLNDPIHSMMETFHSSDSDVRKLNDPIHSMMESFHSSDSRFSISSKNLESNNHDLLQQLPTSWHGNGISNALNEMMLRDQILKEQTILEEYQRRRPPPLRSAELGFDGIYKAAPDRLFARESLSIVGMGLPPPLVRSSHGHLDTPPNLRLMNGGRPNSINSSTNLVRIPNDNGQLQLR